MDFPTLFLFTLFVATVSIDSVVFENIVSTDSGVFIDTVTTDGSVFVDPLSSAALVVTLSISCQLIVWLRKHFLLVVL